MNLWRDIKEYVSNVRIGYIREVNELNETVDINRACIDATNYYTNEGRTGAWIAMFCHPIKEIIRIKLMYREYKEECEEFEIDMYGK